VSWTHRLRRGLTLCHPSGAHERGPLTVVPASHWSETPLEIGTARSGLSACGSACAAFEWDLRVLFAHRPADGTDASGILREGEACTNKCEDNDVRDFHIVSSLELRRPHANQFPLRCTRAGRAASRRDEGPPIGESNTRRTRVRQRRPRWCVLSAGWRRTYRPLGDLIRSSQWDVFHLSKRALLRTQRRSNRSRVITLVQAITKSRTNLSCPSVAA